MYFSVIYKSTVHTNYDIVAYKNAFAVVTIKRNSNTDVFTYFSRQFKKSTSLTPSAYRKTHADEDEE